MAKLKVENVIASADLQKQLDLQEIAKMIKGQYNPDDFPAVMYKMGNPKTSFLIFKDGKIICSGAKNIEDSEIAIEKLIDAIKESKNLRRETIKIQNIVAQTDLNMNLDLNSLKDKLLMGTVEYNPEDYPFLIYHLKIPKISALLFNNGKIVITDATEERDANKAIMKIEEEIRQITKT